jgi:hypothetical protein
MAKPTSKPEWTVGNPDFGTVTVEPSAAKKEAGWLPDERPPREFMNWLFNNMGEWIDFFEAEIDNFSGQSVIYDAFVGGGGTHADINALMADPDIATKKNILIVSTLAVDDTQIINQAGMNFTFQANAGITKNGPTGAVIGLQIDADRVRILNGRFLSFNVGGDKAMQVNGNNCLIQGNMFNDNNTAIENLGNNNELTSNIEEV